jgi:hypothetical protein
MRWNNELHAKYRELAVTDVSKIEVGKTYYSNSYPSQFTVKEIITYGEHAKRVGVLPVGDADELGWILPVGGKNWLSDISLSDRNVSQSYNPWMIFEEESVANECRETLNNTITYESDLYDDSNWNSPYAEWSI